MKTTVGGFGGHNGGGSGPSGPVFRPHGTSFRHLGTPPPRAGRPGPGAGSAGRCGPSIRRARAGPRVRPVSRAPLIGSEPRRGAPFAKRRPGGSVGARPAGWPASPARGCLSGPPQASELVEALDRPVENRALGSGGFVPDFGVGAPSEPAASAQPRMTHRARSISRCVRSARTSTNRSARQSPSATPTETPPCGGRTASSHSPYPSIQTWCWRMTQGGRE